MAVAPGNPAYMMANPSRGVFSSPVQGGPPPTSPPPMTGTVGSTQSITPGMIVFTEYQARVFNQTEQMYKTNGFLGISLFEDSYLLSKATAAYVVGNIPLSGLPSQYNSLATQTYRAVLGIPAPSNPPPPPPQEDPGPANPNSGGNQSAGGNTIQPAPGNVVQVADTPTVFTNPTAVAPVSDVGLTPNNTPTSISVGNELAENPGASGPAGGFNFGLNGFNGGLGGSPTPMGGGKIICNELYRQGYLSEELWNADEKYGEMLFENDPKLIIGYQMWARKVVKYMRKNPKNTKLAYWVFKPWTEYMGYKMGIVEKPTLRGRFTNWIGSQFSYMVFNLYNGKRLLDKYNYKLFRQENNIPNYKMA